MQCQNIGKENVSRIKANQQTDKLFPLSILLAGLGACVEKSCMKKDKRLGRRYIVLEINYESYNNSGRFVRSELYLPHRE